jgi:hypothetical protein
MQSDAEGMEKGKRVATRRTGWQARMIAFHRHWEGSNTMATTCSNYDHIILYVHSIDLLIWSPTQLNFSFYDFSVIYYDFSKLF